MVFEMPSCGGCRTCEMACSFKQTGQFQPQKSIIRILEKDDFAGYLVSFSEESPGYPVSCRNCETDEVPLCMVYCRKREDLAAILREYLGKSGSR